MKGIVVERACGPEVLQFHTVPTPELRPDWILIRVKAFGLNRSLLTDMTKIKIRRSILI